MHMTRSRDQTGWEIRFAFPHRSIAFLSEASAISLAMCFRFTCSRHVGYKLLPICHRLLWERLLSDRACQCTFLL